MRAWNNDSHIAPFYSCFNNLLSICLFDFSIVVYGTISCCYVLDTYDSTLVRSCSSQILCCILWPLQQFTRFLSWFGLRCVIFVRERGVYLSIDSLFTAIDSYCVRKVTYFAWFLYAFFKTKLMHLSVFVFFWSCRNKLVDWVKNISVLWKRNSKISFIRLN